MQEKDDLAFGDRQMKVVSRFPIKSIKTFLSRKRGVAMADIVVTVMAVGVLSSAYICDSPY